jgi:hypothetical protein
VRPEEVEDPDNQGALVGVDYGLSKPDVSPYSVSE